MTKIFVRQFKLIIMGHAFINANSNFFSGDVDSADNEDETDSEMQTKANHGHNYDEILQRRQVYENNRENDAVEPNAALNVTSNNCYLSNSHGILRSGQLLRTRVKHETKL